MPYKRCEALSLIESDGGFAVAEWLGLPSDDHNGKSKTVYVEIYVLNIKF